MRTKEQLKRAIAAVKAVKEITHREMAHTLERLMEDMDRELERAQAELDELEFQECQRK